ncbi:MAG: hypothetical protein D3924_07095 [Candidatus Electrothrix sp. AR4]|nr:hypothetical protein [Candidatus Electrothrix sp. AR4]
MKKKISFRSIAFGCTLLFAATVGAWFLFLPEIEEIQQESAKTNSVPISSGSQSIKQGDNKTAVQAFVLEDEEEKLEAERAGLVENVQEISGDALEEGGTGTGVSEPDNDGNGVQDDMVYTVEQEDGLLAAKEGTKGKESREETAEERLGAVSKTVSLADASGIQTTVQGKEEKTKINQVVEQSCEHVSPILASFFNDIEQQGYSKEFNLNQPLSQYLNELKNKVFANPPVVINETDELYTILTNTAHFFRILGKKDVLLVKRVLEREKERMEDVAAELYLLSGTEQCLQGNVPLDIPLGKVYEYAGFFLNTMGGRSYLFRRDSKSRLLINYYALLLIEEANKKNLNSYGMDISEMIPWLIREMEANSQLAYKERYLDRLYELAEKYQSLP